MTIKILSAHPDGSAHCVHSSPSLGEHFFTTRPRDFGDGCVIACVLCDALTWVHDSDANEDGRNLRAMIAAGLVPVDLRPIKIDENGRPVARTDEHDAFLFAKQDGDPTLAGEALIPASDAPGLARPKDIRHDAPRRRALKATLRATHKDRRPAGTRFQKRIGDVLEVHEDDGTGKITVAERWAVKRTTREATRPVAREVRDDEGRLTGETEIVSEPTGEMVEVETLERI